MLSVEMGQNGREEGEAAAGSCGGWNTRNVSRLRIPWRLVVPRGWKRSCEGCARSVKGAGCPGATSTQFRKVAPPSIRQLFGCAASQEQCLLSDEATTGLWKTGNGREERLYARDAARHPVPVYRERRREALPFVDLPRHAKFRADTFVNCRHGRDSICHLAVPPESLWIITATGLAS